MRKGHTDTQLWTQALARGIEVQILAQPMKVNALLVLVYVRTMHSSSFSALHHHLNPTNCSGCIQSTQTVHGLPITQSLKAVIRTADEMKMYIFTEDGSSFFIWKTKTYCVNTDTRKFSHPHIHQVEHVRIVSTHDSTNAIQNIHSSSTNSLSTGTIGFPSSLCLPAKAGAFCLELGDLPLALFNGIAQERCCTADRLLYEPAQYSTAPHAPPRSRSTKCSVDSFCML
jgi:hypothetical protein